LETISLCPGYLIGPRDVRPTSNELLLYAARSRWPILPPGGMNVLDVREAALAHVRALWHGEPGQRYVLAGPYRGYRDLAVLVRRILGKRERVRALPNWTKSFGTMLLALASGIWPDVPDGLTVPSFQYGFVSYHLSGARADRTFDLTHRPPEETVFDALRWFRDNEVAPWLPERLNPLHPDARRF
jgi:dihydroflavonol-4-reductase